ncbi:hypothetical protein [Lactiplantibacillus songbeiensis]|uniref:Uncharacterized protein n=1 Tax=Lactiplantibacillus songbeiensis TaxID=2559920 RepID=A0ABW4C4V1_9LACO|nr:hypothetical protein [Lactiplantibacillus songbeiensis]
MVKDLIRQDEQGIWISHEILEMVGIQLDQPVQINTHQIAGQRVLVLHASKQPVSEPKPREV